MPASRVGYVYDSGLADYIPFTGPPASLPSGMVTMTAANTAPTGWQICNGAAISRTTYADLFTAIGTTYGVGNGSTTFNIPDMRGRVVAGADSSQTEFDALGEKGGEKTVTLTTAQIPSHSHANTASFSGNYANTGDDGPDHSHTAGHFWGEQGTANWCLANGGGRCWNLFSYVQTNGANTRHQHGYTPSGSVSISNAFSGGGGSHNNLQPYIVLNYIIKE